MKNLKVANKLLIFLKMSFTFNKQILNVLLTHFTFFCFLYLNCGFSFLRKLNLAVSTVG